MRLPMHMAYLNNSDIPIIIKNMPCFCDPKGTLKSRLDKQISTISGMRLDWWTWLTIKDSTTSEMR